MLIYLRPQMLIILLLGIASGVPIALTASTLSAMLEENGLSLATIGLFGAVATPYAFKYLWSPLVDNIRIPILYRFLGHRRSWLIIVQIFLAAAIIAMGMVNPITHIGALAILATMVAFLSATQDIVIDAFRIELLKESEQGAGAASVVFGYRIGMLISGAGALYMATTFGWAATYLCMPLVFIPAMIIALLYKAPEVKQFALDDANFSIADWLTHSFISPFTAFIKQEKWLWLLLLVSFYKLSDAYLGMMTTPFLLQTGFTKIEIAQVVKLFGLIATFCGFFVGGYLASQVSIKGALVIGIILQSLSNLSFVAQAMMGHDITTLMWVISVENFCSGVSGTILIAFIVSITNRNFTATHYALLSSLAVIGRALFSSTAGIVVENTGWVNFFFISAILSLPAALCLYIIYYRR